MSKLQGNRKRRRDQFEAKFKRTSMREDFLDACRLGLKDEIDCAIREWPKDNESELRDLMAHAVTLAIQSKSAPSVKRLTRFIQYECRKVCTFNADNSLKRACKEGTDDIACIIADVLVQDRGEIGGENLIIAARHGRYQLCKRICEDEKDSLSEKDIGNALYKAVDAGHVDVFQVLYDQGTSITYKSPIEVVKNVHILRKLLQDERVELVHDDGEQVAVMYAIENKCVEVLAELLKEPRVDPSMCSFHDHLHSAVQLDSFEMVKLLLEDGRCTVTHSDITEALKLGNDDIALLLMQQEGVFHGYKVSVECI